MADFEMPVLLRFGPQIVAKHISWNQKGVASSFHLTETVQFS